MHDVALVGLIGITVPRRSQAMHKTIAHNEGRDSIQTDDEWIVQELEENANHDSTSYESVRTNGA